MKKVKHSISLLLLATCIAAGGTVMGEHEVEASASSDEFQLQYNRFITSGFAHNLVIDEKGDVYSFGRGRPSGFNFSVMAPAKIDGITNAVSVGYGLYSSFVLTADGSVYAFGDNDNGELGLGNKTVSDSPRKMTHINHVVDVASGHNHTLFLTADGSVYSVGRNMEGQLGLSDKEDRLLPTKIPGIEQAISISTGYDASYILTADGSVYSFGTNYYGSLGLGEVTSTVTIPTKLTTIEHAVSVHSMRYHVLIVTADGSVYSFGDNMYGQLGLGDAINRNLPEKIPGINNAVSAFAAHDHSLILTADGSVYSFGKNEKGQLGHGDRINRNTPTKITSISNAVSVTGGYFHSIIVTGDGNLHAMGAHDDGQLGIGYNPINALSPTKILNFSLGKKSLTSSPYTQVNTSELKAYRQNNRLITSGQGHNLIIANNGYAYSFGRNDFMQTGQGNSSGTPIIRNAVWVSTRVPNVVGIGNGYTSSFVVTADGQLYAFGRNDYYAQLGLGSYGTPSAPQVVSTINNVINVAGGEHHSLFLRADGSVYSVGKNDVGQLGLGDTTERKSPTKIPGITDAVIVASGLNSSYIVTKDGSVYSFGSNEFGALGQGASPTTTNVPTKINGLEEVVVLEAMHSHVLAVTKDGSVYAFGSNAYGQLGLGDTTNRSIPTQIPTVSDIVDADATVTHSLLLTEDGAVYSFGRNQYGQLGLGHQSNVHKPTKINAFTDAVALAGGENHSLVITKDGSVYAMGDNSAGSLGFGSELGYKLSPAKIPDFTMDKGITYQAFVHTYDQIDQIASMSMGGFMVLSHDKYVNYSGTGTSEISGFGDTTQRNTSTRLPRISDAIAVQRSTSHSLILTQDNSLYAFGYNTHGELGFGDTTERTIPTKIPFDFGKIRNIRIGNGSSFVITENGEAYVFGANQYAQLGLGDKENRTSPTKFTALNNIADIKTSDIFTLFLTDDGSVYVSGRNEYGQLGLGDTTERLVPTKIPGIENATAIALGNYHALVLTEDGSVYSWGRNQYGQLGFGDTTTRMTPVKIPNVRNVASINASTHSSYFVTKDGIAYSFGNNSFGQLGVGDTTSRYIPTKIPGISNATFVGAAWTNAFILTDDTKIYTFGDNGFGQLSLGDTTDRLTPVNVPYRYTTNIGLDYRSPSAFLSLDTKDLTDQNVTITVDGYDFGGSKLKRIKLPDGTYTKNASATFTATKNGTYTFEFEDFARNKSTKSITVTNISDTTAPNLVTSSIEGADYVNGNHHWVGPNSTFTLHLKGNDEGSGITRMLHTLERTDDTGTLVREFGDFDTLNNTTVQTKFTHFTVAHHAMIFDSGAEKEVLLTLRANPETTLLHYDYRYNMHDAAGHNLYALNGYQNVDTNWQLSMDGEKPIGVLTQNISEFTNSTVTITAAGSDGFGSGMKGIKLPNGSFANSSTATYSVSGNGTYTFEFVDYVGNVTTESITIANIDKVAPIITFTPESREADLKDISVQTAITDSGGSGYKQFRYVWTKDEILPTEGWSSWDTAPSPLVTQSAAGKWYLHMEATDHAGNVGYAVSGIYEKIALSGGPSVNINVFPTPTGVWTNNLMDVYVMDSGDAELLAKAKKHYKVTPSPLYPSEFSDAVPSDKKVPLTLQGENFIHVQYVLDDGTKISSTTGPYLIDTGGVGDFDMKVTDASGNEASNWSNLPLKLVMSDPSTSSVSGIQKQYRIEGVHTDWLPYTDGLMIHPEGNQRIFGRIVSGTGASSEQKIVFSAIDQTKPELVSLKLSKQVDGTYSVSAKATDRLSGIKEVRLNNGIVLTQTDSTYTANNVSVKPTHLIITDYAGNQLSPVSFAKEPVIQFDAPYTTENEWYKEDVTANLTQATGFLIGSRAYACSEEPCRVVIAYNTTLTAVHTEGNKETRNQIKLSNIDKATYQLVMSGKRNPNNPLEITFKWNLSLSDGTMRCVEDGTTVNYAVSEKSLTLSGKNYTYDCMITGTYKGQLFTSNSFVIYAHGSLPFEGGSDVTNEQVNVPVFMTETRMGKSYIINGKSNNYKYMGVPIPQNDITSN